MYTIVLLGCAVLSASLSAPQAASAQAAAAASRPNVVRLLHRDSLSALTLTNSGVIFQYTAAGIAHLRHRIDSTTATYPDASMATLVRKSAVGAFQGMHMEFPIRDMGRAEAMGATVRISFKESSHASDDPMNHRFEFDAIDASAARSFVLQLTDLLQRRQ
jgi:hypothetical protein